MGITEVSKSDSQYVNGCQWNVFKICVERDSKNDFPTEVMRLFVKASLLIMLARERHSKMTFYDPLEQRLGVGEFFLESRGIADFVLIIKA